MLIRRVFLLILLAALPVRGQAPFLVKDVNQSAWNYGTLDAGAESEAVGSLFFFDLDDGIHGEEIWRSDGTSQGTWLLKDLCPGDCSSFPHSLTASNGLLFFVAFDAGRGFQLWKSDGSPQGTSVVKDLYAGPGYIPLPVMDGGGRLFFTVQDASKEIWVTDGTEVGTVRLGLPPGAGFVSHPLAAGNGKLLFAVYGSTTGLEPWITDGTSAGTHAVADLNPGFGDSLRAYNPADSGKIAVAAPWGGFVFLADDGTHGPEVWQTDAEGTGAGTVLLKDVTPGATGSSPFNFAAANGRVAFSAADPTHGTEVWGTDGTPAGTVLLKDIRPGSDGSTPQDFTPVGSRIFFRASDPDHGDELWATNGTPAGTYLVRDVLEGPTDTFYTWGGQHAFTDLGGGRLLFFSPADNFFWTTDGTEAGTLPVLPPAGYGAWPYPEFFFQTDWYGAAAGRLFFRTDLQGQRVWTTDGTSAGSSQVKSISLLTSSLDVYLGDVTPGSLASFGGALVFQATDGFSYGLWKSDGSSAGTTKLSDTGRVDGIRTVGSRFFFRASQGLGVSDGTPAGTQVLEGYYAAEITPLGGQALFLSSPPGHPAGLYKSDGTAAGTTLVAPYDSIWYPVGLTTAGSKVFYRESDDSGFEIWASDGTGAGTVLLDVEPGAGSSYPDNFTAAGSTLYFSAYRTGSGRELWKTDGTPAGTVLVKDIKPGFSDGLPFGIDDGAFAVLPGGVLLFPADDGTTGAELWRSDGTDAGTAIVKDVLPGSSGSRISNLTVVGNRAFFVADDGVHGLELWVTDGTGAGTRLVRDLVPGADSSLPHALTAAGSALVFTAYTPDGGVESWRSDGTALGTRSLGEIAIGPLSSSPSGYTLVGSNVFLAANDNFTGFEPWMVPMTNVLATFRDVPTNNFAWRFVEGLVANGVSSGCGAGQYCPDAPVTRAEMAVLLLTARGGGAPPPATGTRFQDVPSGYWAGPWIEQLAAEGVVGGCTASPPLYCPGDSLTRAQMAVLLVGARHEAPASPTGTLFADVPADHWAAPWIERLAADGITGGCGGGNFCPDRPVTRAEMAVFLTTAFHLPLP